MDASYSPGRSPSKHAERFNRHRFATARGTREAMAHQHERLQRQSSPNCAFAVLAAPIRRSGLSSRASIKSKRTISARRGGVNWKMDKLTRGQAVARPGKSGARNL